MMKTFSSSNTVIIKILTLNTQNKSKNKSTILNIIFLFSTFNFQCYTFGYDSLNFARRGRWSEGELELGIRPASRMSPALGSSTRPVNWSPGELE